MSSNNVKNINRCVVGAVIGLVSVAVLLIVGFVIAQEQRGIVNIIISVVAMGSILSVVVTLKLLILPDEEEKLNKESNEFLNGFKTHEFVKLYGNMANDSNKKFAFLFFSLIDFQEFNKRNGYAAGDRKLAEVCRIIQSVEKADDKFVSCFGTHFEGIFSYEDEKEIFEFIGTLCEKVKAVKFAFGISLVSKSSENLYADEEKAQMALEKAKKERKTYEIVRAEEVNLVREYVLANMNRALADGEFVMYLQPQYDIIKKEVCGADALVRWIRNDGTVLLPQDMIKVFEETGFIMKVDLAILEQACIKINEWLSKGYTPIQISIKISKLHVLNSSFIKSICQMISIHKIPTKLIEFDISQTSISVTLDKLMDLNQRFEGRETFVSFDDFGKGTSAIKVLQELPANTIRCNGELFNVANSNVKIYDVISKMLDIFDKNNVKVVAENIETENQIKLLKKLNARYAMGFYFSKPVSADKFDEIVFNQ